MASTSVVTLTTPTDCEVALTRTFAAPRTLVWQTLTQPDLLKRWLSGPPGWSLVVCQIDLQIGGAYRFVWGGPDGLTMAMSGAYREIVEPDYFTNTESYDDPWYPGQAIVRHVLTERNGETTLTLSVRYDSREVRDGVLKTPMEEGVASGYDKLAGLLAAMVTA